MQNLSFEEAGAAPGAALNWTLVQQASLFTYAEFGDGTAAEVFDWDTADYLFAFDLDDLDLAQYSGDVLASSEGEERFEAGWGNVPYYTDSFPSTAGTPDDFDTGWDNAVWNTDFETGSSTAALYLHTPFASDNVESFTGGWNNGAWASGFVTGTTADYSGILAQPAEVFEYKAPAVIISINTATDVLTLGAAPASDSRVRFTRPVAGTVLPAPIAFDTIYWAVYQTATTIKLSFVAGGGQLVDLTSLGTAYVQLEHPGEFWPTLLP